MQSFSALQHSILSLAFQSTYQILLRRFQGLLSLQARLQVLELFHFFLSFSPTLTLADTAVLVIIPFRCFLSITIMSCLHATITCHTEH